MITKVEALVSLKPDAQWVMYDDEIKWLSPNIQPPTEAQIQAEVARLQAEYDAQAYARSRVTEYPPIGDQLDALFKAGVFPAEMAAAIQAVKDKYPKGGAV